MKATLNKGKLQISGDLDPKKFKTGKKGWYASQEVTVGGKKIRLNLMAYEVKNL